MITPRNNWKISIPSYNNASSSTAGRHTKRTLGNNTFTVYNYDGANQLTTIEHSRTSVPPVSFSRYEYLYDTAGNRTQMVGTAGSSVRSESYSYDAADQLTGVTYKTGSTVERIVSYFYDAAGNRTGLVERIGSTTNITSYAANSDNQLTSVTATRQGLTVTGYVEPGPRSNKWYASVARARSQESVVSGQNGTFAIPGVPVTGGANALTVTVTDVSGNVATQVVNVTVISGQPVSIGYDANGNQTNHNDWAMAYDRENRLTEARSQESVVSYSYDPLGRLIRRVAYTNDSGSWILTSDSCLYYAGWQVIAEYDGDGNLQRKYVYGPGIDEPIRMTSGGANYYYHADGLGSVTEITDVTGNLVESYRYDVFGTPTMYDHSAIRISQSAIGNRLLFTGRDYDPDTGWYNYRHRYYNPALGRFVQPDPIGINSGDINLYRYCLNNAVNNVDPEGKVVGWVAGGVLVVATAVAYLLDPWIEMQSDPKGFVAETRGPFTFYGPEYKSLPSVLQEATRFHERHHKYHQWTFLPWNKLGREIDAYQAERAWLLDRRKKAKSACDRASLDAIDSQIRDIDSLLANNAALLRQTYGF